MAFKFALILSFCFVATSTFAKVNLRAPITSIQEGSYLLVDAPLLIRKGTTSLHAVVKKPKGKKLLGPVCQLRLSAGTGFNIFNQNLVIKSGSKLFIRKAGTDLSLESENGDLKIPVVCKNYVKSKNKIKEMPGFTVKNMAQVFSRIGILYISEDQRMASN